MIARVRDEFRIEDPIHQIVLVLEMIIKGHAAQLTPLRQIADGDLVKRLFLQKLLLPRIHKAYRQISCRISQAKVKK